MFEKLKRQLKETVQPGLQQSGNLLKITKLRSKVQLSSKNIVSFVLTTNEVYTNWKIHKYYSEKLNADVIKRLTMTLVSAELAH